MYIPKRLIWAVVLTFVVGPVLGVTVVAPALFILLNGAQH